MAQLSLSITTGGTTANLTGLSYTDWAAWNNVASYSPNERKSGGGTLITCAAYGAATPFASAAAPITVSWTDGTPTASSTNTGAVVTTPLNTTGIGYEVTFPASRATRIARLFQFVGDATLRVTAIISDASTGNQVDSTTLAAGVGVTLTGDIQVTYSAASDNKTMTVRVEVLSSASASGGHGIQAAAVKLNSPELTGDPASAASYEGQTANFTVSATTSGGALSYQWKDDGASVGTNSNSYTTAAAVFSDNLSQITCEVTDSNGTTVSNAATWAVFMAAKPFYLRA